jgi:hypothetical protein
MGLPKREQGGRSFCIAPSYHLLGVGGQVAECVHVDLHPRHQCLQKVLAVAPVLVAGGVIVVEVAVVEL